MTEELGRYSFVKTTIYKYYRFKCRKPEMVVSEANNAQRHYTNKIQQPNFITSGAGEDMGFMGCSS